MRAPHPKKEEKKKVKFEDDEEDETDKGGAIRQATVSEVPVHTRRIEYEEPLDQPVDDDRKRYDDDTTDTDSDDEDNELYSHLGGKLSGRGMMYDPPGVRNYMMNTFSQHPEVLSAYIQGRVVNPTYEDPVSHTKDTIAHQIDFGGSMNSISHIHNGVPVAYNPNTPSEFHII